jgi:hypothetical protein
VDDRAEDPRRPSSARWKTAIASAATATPIAATSGVGTPSSPIATKAIKNAKTTAV